jgi:NADH-quinone oxidoreductase subunit N
MIAQTSPLIATPSIAWSSLLPQLILMVGGVIGLTVVSLFKKRPPRGAAAAYTILVATASLISTIPLWHRVLNPREGAAGLVANAVALDGFSLFITALLCIAVILVALVADGYLVREGLEGPELFVLLLLSASGGAVMASANDLIVMFIGLEILSISAYVMAAMHARRLSSQEAGIKYFVLGAFASAFLLYGVAMIYGATGSTNLGDIQSFLARTVILHDGLLLTGLALMLVGFGFKVAAVPFHQWTPDVYQGAPSPVTAFMASAVKVAGFAGLIRVFTVTFGTYVQQWRPAIFALATLSLLVGSTLAVVQSNVKRMLAYSSISHAGFILVGVQAASAGTSAALFYLGAYTFMVIGSFAVVTLVGRTGDGRHSLDDYKGLSRSRPVLALAFTILLLAQAGTPFTAGFFAKFGVIAAAADTHNWSLAIIAMLTAVISAFLYLRVIVYMYFAGEEGSTAGLDGPPVRVPRAAAVAIGIAVVATLALGIVPQPFVHLTKNAVAQIVTVGG